jgi:hypothetical protein
VRAAADRRRLSPRSASRTQRPLPAAGPRAARPALRSGPVRDERVVPPAAIPSRQAAGARKSSQHVGSVHTTARRRTRASRAAALRPACARTRSSMAGRRACRPGTPGAARAATAPASRLAGALEAERAAAPQQHRRVQMRVVRETPFDAAASRCVGGGGGDSPARRAAAASPLRLRLSYDAKRRNPMAGPGEFR